MKRRTTPELSTAEVQQAFLVMRQARSRGPARRSQLYLWLRRNHDALLAEFARQATNWSSLAGYLGENGILDGDAKPPTPRGTRDAWFRARRDVAEERRQFVMVPAPASMAGDVAPGVSTATQPAAVESGSSDAGDHAGEPPRQFRMASLRGHTPSAVVSPASAPELAKQVQDPDEVIARLMGPSTRSRFKPNE